MKSWPKTTAIVVLVLAMSGMVSWLLAELSRIGHAAPAELSCVVCTASMYSRDASGEQFHAFRYNLVYRDIVRADIAGRRLRCWAELTTKEGALLERWEGKQSLPMGSSGTISIRASLKEGKARCEVTATPDVPGFSDSFIASPRHWEGGLCDFLGYIGAVDDQVLRNKEHELMHFTNNDMGHVLRIKIRFGSRYETGGGSEILPPTRPAARDHDL